VLMGAGSAVIGPRLWSGPRLAAGSAVMMLVMCAVLGLSWLLPMWRHSDAVASTPVSKPVVMGAVAAAASAPRAAVVAAPASAAVAALPEAPAMAVVPPVDVQAQTGRVNLPALSAMISGEAKAAARAQRQSRAPLVPVAAPVQTADAVPDKAVVARSFALSTRPLRTRAEAEQVQAAMSALLRSGTAGKLGKVQTDILPQGEDWRVVGMPFAQRDLAEQARRLLVARGMRVEVVAF
jgi:hypothetical protein